MRPPPARGSVRKKQKPVAPFAGRTLLLLLFLLVPSPNVPNVRVSTLLLALVADPAGESVKPPRKPLAALQPRLPLPLLPPQLNNPRRMFHLSGRLADTCLLTCAVPQLRPLLPRTVPSQSVSATCPVVRKLLSALNHPTSPSLRLRSGRPGGGSSNRVNVGLL